MLALAKPTEAKIVYTPADMQIYSFLNSNQHSQIPLDLTHDGKADFSFMAYNTTNGTNSWGRVRMQPAGRNGVEGIGHVKRLAKGKSVGPSHHFSGTLIEACHWDDGNGSYCRGNWYGAVSAYLGLKFRIRGKVHYGWARLNVRANNFELDSVTLTGYAYETVPNKPIVTGKKKGPDAISVQPASLGHLAQGASAIPAWRVKQTAATTH
jgi:hypothetical protein